MCFDYNNIDELRVLLLILSKRPGSVYNCEQLHQFVLVAAE